MTAYVNYDDGLRVKVDCEEPLETHEIILKAVDLLVQSLSDCISDNWKETYDLTFNKKIYERLLNSVGCLMKNCDIEYDPTFSDVDYVREYVLFKEVDDPIPF